MSYPRFIRRRARNSQASGHARRHRIRPCLEALDDRCLLSTITVNTAQDSGVINNPMTVTLRAAILEANQSAPGTTIDFSIGGASQDIMLASGLPAITADGVTIDGTTQAMSIVIDGKNAGNIAGLTLLGNDCRVVGLSIVNCRSAGILVEGTGDAIGTGGTPDGCFIGTDFAFGANKGDGDGISVFGARSLTIESCFIYDNVADGIAVSDAAGILIQGNHVYSNVDDGLLVVGGAADENYTFVTSIQNNYFNLNTGDGVHLDESSDNLIGGGVNSRNLIGDDGLKASVEGNGGDGVLIEALQGGSSTNNTITGNAIAGNTGNGVRLTGPGTSDNSLINNEIGVTYGMTVEHYTPRLLSGNRLDGVAVSDGANLNRIGGTGLYLNDDAADGSGNLIIGSGGAGVELSDAGTMRNAVQGNLIGIDRDGISGDANGAGVVGDAGASDNEIGGFGKTAIQTGQGNLISDNVIGGVELEGVGTSGNLVLGNSIGTDLSGLISLPNLVGVIVDGGASDNRVGLALGELGMDLGNLISGNSETGVLISDVGTTGNVVRSNEIGTTLAGDAALGNGMDGVDITHGAIGNTVGGPDEPENSYLPGNVISGNQRDGVRISQDGTIDNKLEGNFVGTDASGLLTLGNALDGVVITERASANIIGGIDPAMGNVISGNAESGVVINLFAAQNTLQYNEIGTIGAGTAALGNGLDGVDLRASRNRLLDNLISGNVGAGVVIAGSSNVLQGDKIGTDILGTSAVPNHQDGIDLDVTIGSGLNVVGGTLPTVGNLISGNLGNGIEITGTASTGNLIEGNDIGTNVDGNQSLYNDKDGVLVANGAGYTIGGQSPGSFNVISGNLRDGIEIGGSASTAILVQNNRIGTSANGKSAVGNAGNGVHIDEGASHNLIGGIGAQEGNLISGNLADGVLIEGGSVKTQYNILLGNRIGTNGTGKAPLANQGQGVEIRSSSFNSVGGDIAGGGNLISGNAHAGIEIVGGSDSNSVFGDLIGTDITGTAGVGNGGDGVDILQSSDSNTIGGIHTTFLFPGNVISGNHGSGVLIDGEGTSKNRVLGNFIGTTQGGKAVLGNKLDGVDILGSAEGNEIGAGGGVVPAGAGNRISGNARDGVRISGRGTKQNLVQGNAIGTSASGQVTFGNGAHGVFVFDYADFNTIGGLSPDDGNQIAYNGGAGVAIGANLGDTGTVANPILSNSIYSNGGLGIDLGDNGVTANTPGSPHAGPNGLQSTPVIESAKSNGAVIIVKLLLNSTPLTTFTIQIFADTAPDPSGHGQGRTLVATVTVTTDLTGNLTAGFVIVPIPQSFAGQYLTATATDSSGNTSEFAKDYRAS